MLTYNKVVMEPRSGLRNSRRGTISSRIHPYDNLVEPESSDEDDNGIPASKVSIVSPAKRLPTSLSRPQAKRVKRAIGSIGDGIVLYPPLQRQKNVLNIRPVPRVPLPDNDLMLPSPAIFEPSPRPYSPSLTPEDEVSEGLIREVNDALRQLPRREPENYTERQVQDSETLSSHPSPKLNYTKEYENRDDHGRGFTSCNLSGSISPALPLDHIPQNTQVEDYCTAAEPALNGEAPNQEEERENSTSVPRIQVEVAASRENEAGAKSQALVESRSKRVHDVWKVQSSPELQGGYCGHRQSSDPKLQNTKERRNTAKSPSLVNTQKALLDGLQTGAKRKVGRPKKNQPRLSSETDAHIAGFRKPNPSFTDQEPQSFRESTIGRDDSASNEVNGSKSGQLSQKHVCLPSTESSVTQAQAHGTLFNKRDGVASDSETNKLASCLCAQVKDEARVDTITSVDEVPQESIARDHDRQARSATHPEELQSRRPSDLDKRTPVCTVLGEDDEVESDFVDRSETDDRDDEDESIPAEDRFVRDIHDFNGRESVQPQGDDVFAGPPDSDVITVHINHEPLRQVCTLLGDESWTRIGDRQSRRTARREVETKPVRAFLRILDKLDRLFQATPKAPNLKAQNTFLRQHANMLSYYFYKIKLVLEHIRTQRLELPARNNAAGNTDPRKRKKMVRDLVFHVIPMLARILASAWTLGGEEWLNGSFTCAVVKLLERGLGWMMVLHRRVLRELRRCSIEEPSAKYRDQTWQIWNAKKEEIDHLLYDLRQLIGAAPEELQRRQRQIERENGLKAQQKLAEAKKARLALIAAQKKRSLLSIHGVHYPVESSASSSRPSRSLTPKPTEWSLEEKTFLFKKIQESFPGPPDIDRLRWELNKTYAETTAVAEDILEKMLAAVKPNQPVDERVAEARRILRGPQGI